MRELLCRNILNRPDFQPLKSFVYLAQTIQNTAMKKPSLTVA